MPSVHTLRVRGGGCGGSKADAGAPVAAAPVVQNSINLEVRDEQQQQPGAPPWAPVSQRMRPSFARCIALPIDLWGFQCRAPFATWELGASSRAPAGGLAAWDR